MSLDISSVVSAVTSAASAVKPGSASSSGSDSLGTLFDFGKITQALGSGNESSSSGGLLSSLTKFLGGSGLGGSGIGSAIAGQFQDEDRDIVTALKNIINGDDTHNDYLEIAGTAADLFTGGL